MRFSFTKYIHIMVCAFFFVSLNADNEKYTVKTSSGITKAVIKNRILYWNDIPYAAPPINDLRWRAPRPINTQDALISDADNNFCIQEPSNLGGVDGDNFFVGKEDCLYLDIKAPKNYSNNKLLPVMFWIHGGGNVSGLKDIYDFSKFVRKHNVIVVSINYRLGPFGWFSHPAIQKNQDGLDQTSNFGTLDIISALNWTKNNIEKFGGDSNNITIFGESAGGHNVLSLIVSSQASGLFNKAIVQSGYTTSISPENAYKQSKISNTSDYTSSKLVNYLLKNSSQKLDDENVRNLLKSSKASEIFKFYTSSDSNQDIPLLTSDGIVIPEIGLKQALGKKEHVNNVPMILGSNKDEVKLWLGTADYFVDVEYSLIGEILNIPKVVLADKNAFEAFNYYRSAAWQIRGVLEPAMLLNIADNNNLYLYRFDWDDHRSFYVANFKELFGAAHATEIPLISGDDGLVGDYGFLIYPKGPSKRFTSKNMMNFWKNFAYFGKPGISSNGVEWNKYQPIDKNQHNLIVIDNKPNLKMNYLKNTFNKLITELNADDRLNEIEKCVVFFQVTTFVGEDIYDDHIKNFSGNCKRSDAMAFIKEHSSYIDF